VKTHPRTNGTHAAPRTSETHGASPTDATPRGDAPPLMSPAQAAAVLDKVLVDRVVNMVDLDELASFECDLFFALRACGIEAVDAAGMSRDMITSAFHRFGEELRMRLGQSAALSDCEMCELEIARERTRDS
jgi:hypothetical protein